MQTEQHIPLDLDRDLATGTITARGDLPYYPPPCDCVDCSSSYRTLDRQNHDRFIYSTKLSDAEATTILREYVSKIDQDREALLEQYVTRGDLIITRWKKRSLQKRTALILQADPDLPKEQYAFFSVGTAKKGWLDVRKPVYRKAYLLPYLTVEQLAKNPNTLFSLLHNRTQYLPEQWAAFDSKLLDVGWYCGAFDVDYNQSAVYMHGDKYGRLTAWSQGQMHRADTVGFPRARLILEAQSTLYRLLRRVVEILLEAPGDTPPSSAKWKDLIDSGFKKGNDHTTWSRFVYQPFSTPPLFQINDMIEQAKSRMNASSDHLWLLQTEPTYLRSYIKDINELSVTKVLARSLSYQPHLREIYGDYSMHQFWIFLHDELLHASQLHQRFRDSIHSGNALPRKYDEVLGAIEILLINRLHMQVKNLFIMVASRPSFSKYFHVRAVGDEILINNKKDAFPSLAAVYQSDPLYWCLMNLQGDPEAGSRYDNGMLFGFLEEHLAKAPREERARMDAMLYEKLSDIGALIDMLTTLRLSRPQNTNRTVSDVLAHDDRKAWRTYKFKDDLLFYDNPARAKLLEDFYKTPPPSGSKGKDWLQSFDAVHAKIQAFWGRYHRDIELVLKKSRLAPEDARANLVPLEMWNSPEHLQLIEQKRKEVLEQLSKPKPPAEFDSFLPLPTSSVGSSAIIPSEPRTKIKTKGEAAAPAAGHGNDAQPEPGTLFDVRIPVTRKALSTFRAIFPSTAEERSKSTDWDAFVGAMIDAGLSASSKGGSAFSFEYEGGRIVFHKPHPDLKIHPNMLQWMGRRLNKWFGWSRETFVVENK
ncbi:hypothetical protein P171DRAFT_262495 [Karstenula rhodostoma CBS 690.94]|uniref:Uncharacterized protein n=1 Tax=Karstenula rhodostoma CBS 690.94 TaxID=1392251 RepID=A0A9P4UEM2_9PLEO|nr:hypothetical protein P171DRAFT_262495 [Karstenula rhodostoma CBS 690.94]